MTAEEKVKKYLNVEWTLEDFIDAYIQANDADTTTDEGYDAVEKRVKEMITVPKLSQMRRKIERYVAGLMWDEMSNEQ